MVKIKVTKEEQFRFLNDLRRFMYGGRIFQKDVADMVGCCPETISGIMNGRRFPSRAIMYRLEELMYAEDRMKVDPKPKKDAEKKKATTKKKSAPKRIVNRHAKSKPFPKVVHKASYNNVGEQMKINVKDII